MCLFYLKLHLQFRNVCWSHQTFPCSQAERESSIGNSAASGDALLRGVLHLLTATAVPVWNSGEGGGSAAISHMHHKACHIKSRHLLLDQPGQAAWGQKIWSQTVVRQCLLIVLLVYIILISQEKFPPSKKKKKRHCLVLKQGEGSHAHGWYPQSFNENFYFLASKSFHYPPEALIVFIFILPADYKANNKWILRFLPTFSSWPVFIMQKLLHRLLFWLEE